MLSKGKGGLEQAFESYNQALLDLSHTVCCVVDPKNRMLPLPPPSLAIALPNFGPWDVFASLRLKQMINHFEPDLIMSHANRATTLLSRFKTNRIPLVGVLHNGRQKNALPCDAIITVAEHIKKSLETKRFAQNPIFILPNLAPTLLQPRTIQIPHQPITIGVLSRLSQEKGVDLFINALAVLKKTVAFKAIIAGDGKERKALEKQANALQLNECVRFIGWVEDKKTFFDEIDIFCLTSRSEGLPVALLEAFAHQKPLVATLTSGAKEICTHGKDAYLTGFLPSEIAFYLNSLIKEPKTRALFVENAVRKIQEKYTQAVFTEKLGEILKTIRHA